VVNDCLSAARAFAWSGAACCAFSIAANRVASVCLSVFRAVRLALSRLFSASAC
jgi:hypothetical protein